MAVVDSFDFLYSHCKDIFASTRDWLAIFGVYYTSKKTLTFTYSLLSSLNCHVLSKMQQQDFRSLYGKWAGTTQRRSSWRPDRCLLLLLLSQKKKRKANNFSTYTPPFFFFKIYVD